MGVNEVFKDVVDRPRPLEPVSGGGESFPSGHTLHAMLTSGLAWLLVMPRLTNLTHRRLLLAAILVWPVLVGISRVHLERHWPSDVLGAYVFGAALLIVMAWVWPRVAPVRPRIEYGASSGPVDTVRPESPFAQSPPSPFALSLSKGCPRSRRAHSEKTARPAHALLLRLGHRRLWLRVWRVQRRHDLLGARRLRDAHAGGPRVGPVARLPAAARRRHRHDAPRHHRGPVGGHQERPPHPRAGGHPAVRRVAALHEGRRQRAWLHLHLRHRRRPRALLRRHGAGRRAEVVRPASRPGAGDRLRRVLRGPAHLPADTAGARRVRGLARRLVHHGHRAHRAGRPRRVLHHPIAGGRRLAARRRPRRHPPHGARRARRIPRPRRARHRWLGGQPDPPRGPAHLAVLDARGGHRPGDAGHPRHDPQLPALLHLPRLRRHHRRRLDQRLRRPSHRHGLRLRLPRRPPRPAAALPRRVQHRGQRPLPCLIDVTIPEYRHDVRLHDLPGLRPQRVLCREPGLCRQHLRATAPRRDPRDDADGQQPGHLRRAVALRPRLRHLRRLRDAVRLCGRGVARDHRARRPRAPLRRPAAPVSPTSV